MGKYNIANKPCMCGSGKKYKKCCLLIESDLEAINQLIHSLTELDLTKQFIEDVLKEIETKIAMLDLSDNVLKDIYINMVQHYQAIGKDKLVLELIEKYKFDESEHSIIKLWYKMIKLIALRNLYSFEKVIELVPELLEMSRRIEWGNSNNNTVKSGVMLELGKTLSILIQMDGGKNQLAIDTCLELYDEIIEVYEKNIIHDIDHYHGALGNKLMLLKKQGKSNSINIVDSIHEVLKKKLYVGNLQGVANAYSMLATHFLNEKDYKQAIAYSKKDIVLSREYGSYLDLVKPLLNLSIIYLECRQISQAKKVAREALQFAEKVKNSELEDRIKHHLMRIDEEAKLINSEGGYIGKNAICPCNSNGENKKLYVECCGEADYDYEELKNVLASPELFHYTDLIRNDDVSNINFDNLKSYLKPLEENEVRVSWLEIVSKGAYQEIYELADMASLNLISAKQLLKDFVHPDLDPEAEAVIIKETSISLSICILSVNSLEAFVNQLIFFLSEIEEAQMPNHIKGNLPGNLLTNVADYQRNTRFEDKLNIIFNLYTNSRWNNFDRYTSRELSKLISIRNELVHFKSQKFTKIIPSNNEENILRNLPKEIELRKVNNSWPLKILNISFAKWCIELSESIINFVKVSYIKEVECNK